LHGIFAHVELPVPPNEQAEDLRRKLAQQVLNGKYGVHISGGASIT
jgi:hypothetical protein